MGMTRRLAVTGAVALTVASCAASVPSRSFRRVPSGPTPAEVSPVLANAPEVQQEVVRAYPPELHEQGVGGRVEVWVYVDSAGRGGSGAVKTSSGNDELDCAAMQVADVMEFEPALNQGVPADVWSSEWVEFRPEAAEGRVADPGRPRCEPWDTLPVPLETNEIERWLDEAYPPELSERGSGGKTLLWLYVTESGEVLKYEIRESSGYAVLDEAAGTVAMNMRFEPARRLGLPTGIWVAQPITFRAPVPTIREPRQPRRPFQGP